ncbi:MAG: RNA-binding S4 domain-containing protein [Bacilli bacterium]|nr:RNA-binding S4 domain-containing protein [Bacilli bacterium]
MSKNYQQIKISTDYITLGQLLKFAGIIDNGSEAKEFIFNNEILVDGEECKMRGKKLRGGEKLEINNSVFLEITR